MFIEHVTHRNGNPPAHEKRGNEDQGNEVFFVSELGRGGVNGAGRRMVAHLVE
jgi:hypothetical protein